MNDTKGQSDGQRFTRAEHRNSKKYQYKRRRWVNKEEGTNLGARQRSK